MESELEGCAVTENERAKPPLMYPVNTTALREALAAAVKHLASTAVYTPNNTPGNAAARVLAICVDALAKTE